MMLALYLRSCLLAWASLYLGLAFLGGLTHVWVHAMGVGALLCLLSYFRLPPPDPESSHALLGLDPRNLDGSPAKAAGARLGLGVIAHRAAGEDAPENSLSAVRLAAEKGARCIEFDVAFTADGQAVVLHDDTVDRTTDGRGPIQNMTWEEAQRLDVAAHHVLKEAFSPERLPSVDAFVSECLALNLKMIMDLKSYREPEKTARFAIELFQRFPGLYSRMLVSSFFPHLIYLIRRQDPKIVGCLAWRPGFLAYQHYGPPLNGPRFDSPLQHYLARAGDVVLQWSVHEFLWYFLGLSAVAIEKNVLTPEYVQLWRERGVRILAWTVNNSLQKYYLENYLRVTIMSDSLDRIPIEEYIQTTQPDHERSPDSQ
ncbi:glycerophosphodiester phosphodiesterase 1-like [Tigriopus californicus]|nr:glycerophosphodiester phosphodiesterase 1-like [Tigriopus californicus]